MNNKINQKEQNRIIKYNAKLSIIFKGLEYFLTFFTVPILLSCLGNYKYGAYTTALSIVSWIYYFDFGIGSGLRNKVSEYIVRGDYERAQNNVNVAYILVSIISCIIFILFFIFSYFFDFSNVLNAELLDENLNVIILVAIFLACLNFVLSLTTSILYSLQRSALVNGLSILSKIFLIIMLFLYRVFNSKLILGVVVIEGVAQLIKNIISFIYVKKVCHKLSPNFININFDHSKDILGFGIQIFFMQIAALVLNSTDNVIIMKYFGADSVTPYSMCHKYFSIINTFYIAAINPLWAAYTNAYTLRDCGYIKTTLKKSIIFYCLTLLAIIISLFIFKPFMKLYLKQDLDYQNGLIFLTALYYAILVFSHNFSTFVHGISKVKITTIASILGTTINIPMSIILSTKFGLKSNGVIIGSILSLIITTTAYIYTTIKEIKKMETISL